MTDTVVVASGLGEVFINRYNKNKVSKINREDVTGRGGDDDKGGGSRLVTHDKQKYICIYKIVLFSNFVTSTETN